MGVLQELARHGGEGLMPSLPSVELTDVSLAYQMAQNRAGTAKEYMINLLKRQVVYDRLWALTDVSMTVDPGEVIGVVGPNGAGKSTLMKLLAGVLHPTEGRVIVRGSVAPLIEVSGGLNQELTGRENIVLLGTLLGRDPKEIRERVDAIAEWADLTEFLEVPVRAYSTGMMARLAFAIATDVKPDVLIVDEVLSVGDESFRGRSLDRIKYLMSGGTSVVMVSHSLSMVEDLCERAIWLQRGHVKASGPVSDVVAAYRASV
jgi:ABC-2 type transport system ATP-binding protein